MKSRSATGRARRAARRVQDGSPLSRWRSAEYRWQRQSVCGHPAECRPVSNSEPRYSACHLEIPLLAARREADPLASAVADCSTAAEARAVEEQALCGGSVSDDSVSLVSGAESRHRPSQQKYIERLL